MFKSVLLAGFGGQGILSAGQLLAYAGTLASKHVTWVPSYGAEMRGGTANCGVTISSRPISSPIVSEPGTLVAMNRPSLEKFEQSVVSNGLIVVNSSLVNCKVARKDVQAMYIPANKLAEELGNNKVAVNIVLGALIFLTQIVSLDLAIESLGKVFPPHNQKLIILNQRALKIGAQFFDHLAKEKAG
jgi:2-oxoglutarate ferredoxin oxidoreductase subunit gamma